MSPSLTQGSLKEGTMKKESSKGRWGSRYFVLHSDRITYYKTNEAKPPPAGVICFSDMAFAAITPKRPYGSWNLTLQGTKLNLGGRQLLVRFFLMIRSNLIR